MPLLQNLRESFGGYWTPKPSVNQQRITRSPSLEEVKSRLDRDSTTPSKRTSDWLQSHSAEIKTPKALGVKGSKVVKPPTSSRQSAKTKSKFWARVLPNFLNKQSNAEDQVDLDGSTVFGEDHPSISPGLDQDVTLLDPAAALQTDAAKASLIAPEKEDTFYEPTAEDLKVMKTWSKDQVVIFHKLNMRGFEPLMPEIWAFEFVTVPQNVFSDNDSEVLIKTHEGNEYNACRALQSLFGLGGRVRDRIACKLRPEDALRRELLAYYKWTIMDGGLSRIDHIPVLAIGTAAHREPVTSVLSRVTDQLHELGRQYRAYFFDHTDPVTGEPVFIRELPTLYGVVITYSIVTFVTYDARFPSKQVQSMGSYDFSNEEQDVWHAFAAAIVFVKARDYLIMLKEEKDLGATLEDGDSDRDA
ncbi:MAG: hypothetical protein Q9181_001563 [Wetmoreana brouardii]